MSTNVSGVYAKSYGECANPENTTDNIYDTIIRYPEVNIHSNYGTVQWHLFKPNGVLYDKGTVYHGGTYHRAYTNVSYGGTWRLEISCVDYASSIGEGWLD